MTALSQFLVLLVIFLLARSGDAFMNLLFRWIIWFNLRNQWANWWMNQITHQLGNQPTIKWMIKHQMKWFSNWNRIYCFLTTLYKNEWLSVISGISKSRVKVLICFKLNLLPTPLLHLRQSMAWITITIKSQWIIKWQSKISKIMRSREIFVNSPKINPIGKGQNKEVSLNLPVFLSQLSILISVQDWIVEFILIWDVTLLLRRVGYDIIKFRASKRQCIYSTSWAMPQ